MSCSGASPVFYESVDELVVEAVGLREKFLELTKKLNEALVNVDGTSLKSKINLTLTCDGAENTHEVNEILKKIDELSCPVDVFNCLVQSNLIGYLNFRLLYEFHELIKDKEINENIAKYEEAFEKFLKSSNLETLTQVFLVYPDLSPKTFVGLPQFTVHLDEEWEKKSAFEWNQLLKTKFNHWPAHIHIHMITKNCIEYSVLPYNASSIVNDLSDADSLALFLSQGVSGIHFSDQLRKLGNEELCLSPPDSQPCLNHPLLDSQPLDRRDNLWLPNDLIGQGDSLVDEEQIVILQSILLDQCSSTTQHTQKDNEVAWYIAAEKNISLLEAVQHGTDTSKILALLKDGADIHTIDHTGDTSLHYAVKTGRKKTIELLLNEGAVKDINLKNQYGYTPLHCAVDGNNAEIVQLLLKFGADVNGMKGTRLSPLQVAADMNHVHIAELLLKAGANVHSLNVDHCTPLHYAAQEGHWQVVELLLKYGANVNEKNKHGFTPLHLASGAKQLYSPNYSPKATVKILLSNGARVNEEDHFGHTPLYYAKEKNYKDIIQLLSNHT